MTVTNRAFADVNVKCIFYMKDNQSPLFSEYIIDGVRHSASPFDILLECMTPDMQNLQLKNRLQGCAEIIDETADPAIVKFVYDADQIPTYIDKVASFEWMRTFKIMYPDAFTRTRVAAALLSRLLVKGHFCLDDICLKSTWYWNSIPVGNMSAFYDSVESFSTYLYDLGLNLLEYKYEESPSRSYICIDTELRPESADEMEDSQIWMGSETICPTEAVDDHKSWVVYIPFHIADYKLGGSMLAELMGYDGGRPPQLTDTCYFMDCYEVVRELIEDGIVLSARVVADGGLGAALKQFTKNVGLSADLSGVISSSGETDLVKILFAEIPGVLIQVSDADYDYLDSQMILQDIAYYPLGHPDNDVEGVVVTSENRAGVADILSSLLNQASEGED